MSKILFIGDLHLDSQTPVSRLDNYRETTLIKLNSLYNMAVDLKAKAIFVTGDFFNRYDIPISYISDVMTVLRKFYDAKIRLYTVIGNHDLPYNNMGYFKNTPLGLLSKSELVKCLDCPENKQGVFIDDVYICGLSFTRNIKDMINDSFDDSIGVTSQYRRILVMHYASENTIPNESIQLDDLQDFEIVVSGHDHMYYPVIKKGKTTLYRPGSFTRRTKDSYNMEREIVVYCYDTTSKKMAEHYLSDVSPAKVIFKSEVLIDKSGGVLNDNYNKLFRSLSIKSSTKNIFEIIDDLPATVSKDSIKAILDYLMMRGVIRNVKASVSKDTEKMAEEFSI